MNTFMSSSINSLRPCFTIMITHKTAYVVNDPHTTMIDGFSIRYMVDIIPRFQFICLCTQRIQISPVSIWTCHLASIRIPIVEITQHYEYHIRVRSQNCSCLVRWFCYQLIAKPGNKTASVPWPHLYSYWKFSTQARQNLTLSHLLTLRPCLDIVLWCCHY